MGIDIFSEHLIPLKDYPKHLPTRFGRRLNRCAGYRHAIAGIRGVKLETVQLPSGRHTSLEAIDRFIARLTARAVPNVAPVAHPGRKADRHQSKVEREIDKVRAKFRKKGKG